MSHSSEAFYKIKEEGYILLSELTKSRKLSQNALAVFVWIGEKVENGNKANISTKDIIDQFNLDKTAVSRILKELEDGLLIVVEHKEGSDRVIAAHPKYWWKGRYELQNNALKRWIADIRKKHWGSVVKQTDEYLSDTEVFLSQQENNV